MATDRKLSFRIELDSGLPAAMTTDEKRLQQIIKNLLSNAFKFTHDGGVVLSIRRVRSGWNSANEVLKHAPAVVAYSVSDTGIGIQGDKLRVIFEAFQQADGTTSRKYGGTGLGLSISREICRLLGGEITVQSSPNQGSCFTLYLPLTFDASWKAATAHLPEPALPHPSRSEIEEALVVPPSLVAQQETPLLIAAELADDRQSIQPGDPVLLIIEDDAKFGQTCSTWHMTEVSKPWYRQQGSARHRWCVASTPRSSRWTSACPIWTAGGCSTSSSARRKRGTFRSTSFPCRTRASAERRWARSRYWRSLSIAPRCSRHWRERKISSRGRPRICCWSRMTTWQFSEITRLIGNGDVNVTRVSTGQEALAALRQQEFDCVVLDLVLPDMDGMNLIEAIRADTKRRLPVIIHSAKDLHPEEEAKLRKLAESFITKGPESASRLFDETALFLHRAVERMPPEQRRIIDRARRREPGLAGRKVLIVDDDIRNIFSLTGVLEQHDIQVLNAENGRDGIALLDAVPNIDMVLMDVMMPDMDGYETMRQIRTREQFRKLPMIAITAKAMKGDREKCIEAGASEYLSKPVDVDHLVSLMRVWLRRV